MLIRLMPLSMLAVAALSQTPQSLTDKARGILIQSLKDKNPDTRKQAVLALSLAGPREPYLTMLDSMLSDKDVEVRLATVASLVDLKSSHTLPSLRKALADDVPEVSFAAAKALWGLRDPAGKGALRSILSGEAKTSSGYFTRQKRDAMRMMHTPRTMALTVLKEGVGFAPIPGLGAGVASMEGILFDTSVSGRATAALLLGNEKDPETLQALREALSDKVWSVRAAAVHSLALRNDAAFQPELALLLKDGKEAVRLRAAAAYLRLDIVKRTPALKRARKKRVPARVKSA